MDWNKREALGHVCVCVCVCVCCKLISLFDYCKESGSVDRSNAVIELLPTTTDSFFVLLLLHIKEEIICLSENYIIWYISLLVTCPWPPTLSLPRRIYRSNDVSKKDDIES
jgi:hypothetical protein